jgi:hypothetical protein
VSAFIGPLKSLPRTLESSLSARQLDFMSASAYIPRASEQVYADNVQLPDDDVQVLPDSVQ